MELDDDDYLLIDTLNNSQETAQEESKETSYEEPTVRKCTDCDRNFSSKAEIKKHLKTFEHLK